MDPMLITAVSTTVKTAIKLYSIIQQVKDNETAAKLLLRKLEFIECELKKEKERSGPETKHSARNVPENIRVSIHADFVTLEDVIQEVARDAEKSPKRTPREFRKYMAAQGYDTKMARARLLAADCQNRLENYQLITVAVSTLKEHVDSLSNEMKERTPESFTEFRGDLNQRLERLQNFMGIILDLVKRDKQLSIDNDDKVDSKELSEIQLFELIIDDIEVLSKVNAKSDITKRLVDNITNMWNSWRIDDDSPNLRYDKKKNGDKRTIGKGTTGCVYSGTFRDPSSGEQTKVAIKTVDIPTLNVQKFCADILRQSFIHIILDHPCIVRLYGVVWPKAIDFHGHLIKSGTTPSDDSDGDEEEQFQISLVMRRVNSNLAKVLNVMNPNDKIKVLYNVADALTYLHSKDIVHRDIKVENILINLNESKQLKENACLCDFGISKRKYDVRNNHNAVLSTTMVQGTPLYRPPEVIVNSKYHTMPSWDVWSFGILICVLLSTQEQPIVNVTSMSEQVSSGQFEGEIMKWANGIEDSELKNLALECLSSVPDKRPNIELIYAELKNYLKE